MRLPRDLAEGLRCPACRGALRADDAHLVCDRGGHGFPVIDGAPILIHDEASVFSVADYVAHRETYFSERGKGPQRRTWRDLAIRLMPDVSANVKAERNLARMQQLLLERSSAPTVLVLGGSILGDGMEGFVGSPRLRVVETDVALSGRVHLVCDGHDIPFADGTFDGVVAQAVLEHVVDPFRVVDEIHRVLKPDGLVYAETAFVQAVHGGRYDFMRFTWLGHRRLFRRFREIESGASCGPGMTVGWAHQYFWRSFTTGGTWAGALARLYGRSTAFFYKYFDRFLIDRPRAWDSASAVYFIGSRSDQVLSDRELIALYHH